MNQVKFLYYRNVVRTNEIAIWSIITVIAHTCAKALDRFPVLASVQIYVIYHTQDGQIAHVDSQKREADSLGGEGGLKSLLWVPAGRGERQIAHSTLLF